MWITGFGQKHAVSADDWKSFRLYCEIVSYCKTFSSEHSHDTSIILPLFLFCTFELKALAFT